MIRDKFKVYEAADAIIPDGLRGYGSDLCDETDVRIDREVLADLIRKARIAAFKEASGLVRWCEDQHLKYPQDPGYIEQQVLLLADQEDHAGPFPGEPLAAANQRRQQA